MKTLNIEEIEGARKRTADNAVALIDAAELLLRSGFAPQSFFFAHAAVEEIAKIPMLVGVGLDIRAGRTIDWNEFGKRFESHREKIQQIWIGLHINANEKIADSELLAKARRWFASDGTAKERREHALYAGVVNVAGEPMAYRSPADVIDYATAEEALTIARLIVKKRAEEEEISRGRLAHTPPGMVELVEKHVEAVMERHRNKTPRD